MPQILFKCIYFSTIQINANLMERRKRKKAREGVMRKGRIEGEREKGRKDGKKEGAKRESKPHGEGMARSRLEANLSYPKTQKQSLHMPFNLVL